MKNNNNNNAFDVIINIFAWLSFVLAIVLASVTIVASFSDEQNGKEVFGVKMLIVNSNSMSKPNSSSNESVYFDAGDVIIIKTIKENQVFKEGDVITFISRNSDTYGKTITHKIREVKLDSNGSLIGYLTYGIYTGSNDQTLVTPTNIIGVYSCKIPDLGNVFSFLKTPRGYFLSILIPCVFLIIFFSIKVGKNVALRKVGLVYDTEIDLLKERVTVLENLLNNNLKVLNSQTAVSLDSSEDVVEMQNTQETNFISEKINLNIKKISFTKKLLSLNEQIKGYYNEIYNEFTSYSKISSRLSFKCISFRKGRKLLAKLSVRGKTLTLYLALNVNDFNKKVYFQKDVANVKAYSEVPFFIKVKSNRGLNNALKLITVLMQNNDVAKKADYERVNAILLLTSNLEEVSIENLSLPNKYSFSKNAKKLSFAKKISKAKPQVKEYYSKILNEFALYNKISSRLSFKCMSFRKGRKLLAKVTVRGKTLTLYLALNVNDFNKNVYFQKDVANVKAYSEVPFSIKVKSDRGLKNALKLINQLIMQYDIK